MIIGSLEIRFSTVIQGGSSRTTTIYTIYSTFQIDLIHDPHDDFASSPIPSRCGFFLFNILVLDVVYVTSLVF